MLIYLSNKKGRKRKIQNKKEKKMLHSLLVASYQLRVLDQKHRMDMQVAVMLTLAIMLMFSFYMVLMFYVTQRILSYTQYMWRRVLKAEIVKNMILNVLHLCCNFFSQITVFVDKQVGFPDGCREREANCKTIGRIEPP